MQWSEGVKDPPSMEFFGMDPREILFGEDRIEELLDLVPFVPGLERPDLFADGLES